MILTWSGYDAKRKVSFHSQILPPLFTYAVDHERKRQRNMKEILAQNRSQPVAVFL